LISACGTLPHKAVPEKLADAAEIPGLEDLRFWGDEAPANIDELAAEINAQLRHRYGEMAERDEPITLNYLALSGGGENGAFGAGFLVGWLQPLENRQGCAE